MNYSEHKTHLISADEQKTIDSTKSRQTSLAIWLILILEFMLITIRIIKTNELMYGFLIWNLFLAGTPIIISSYLYKNHKRLSKLVLLFMLFAWFIFLPNAPYIITDFKHLEHLPPVPLWFDLAIIFLAAIAGLIMGIKSIWHIEEIARNYINKRLMNISLLILCGIIGYGVYLGRFLRWNSWDLFTNPISVIWSLKSTIHIQCIAFSCIIGAIVYVMYTLIYPSEKRSFFLK